MFERLLDLSPGAEWKANVRVYTLSSAKARHGLANRGGYDALNVKAKSWYLKRGRNYIVMAEALREHPEELLFFEQRAIELSKRAAKWIGRTG